MSAHADLDAFLLAHAPHLRGDLDARDPRELAGVLLAPDVPSPRARAVFELVPSLRVLTSGVALAVVPLDVARELAARLDEGAAEHLRLAARPGYLWTLAVFARNVVVAPVGWATARGGSA